MSVYGNIFETLEITMECHKGLCWSLYCFYCTLTLFDMGGGGGHDGPSPKMFFTTVPKRFGVGN